MPKPTIDVSDTVLRMQGAVWFSILEALGPQLAERAIGNMRDFGALHYDSPYCEQLCNQLADAAEQPSRPQLRVIDGGRASCQVGWATASGNSAA